MYGMGTSKAMDQSHFGAFDGNTKVNDFVFAGDAEILTEPLEILTV